MNRKLIFLGSPGAGKGTMATKLAEKISIQHISTGDIFRANIKNRTELGLQVEKITSSGGLVPDELTIKLVADRIRQPDAVDGYILDGFPRTIPQAEAFKEIDTVDAIINFELSEEIAIKRLSGRLMCPNCNHGYHVIDFPPKVKTVCDHCGHALITRKDDSIESISHRLKLYKEETAPLIDFYQDSGKLLYLDSSKHLNEVFIDLLSLLQL